MDETALRQLAGKVGDLGVVFLPLGNMLCACEFGLFLLGARCRSERVLMKKLDAYRKWVLAKIDCLGTVQPVATTCRMCRFV